MRLLVTSGYTYEQTSIASGFWLFSLTNHFNFVGPSTWKALGNQLRMSSTLVCAFIWANGAGSFDRLHCTQSLPTVPLELVHEITTYASPCVLTSLAQTCMAYCVEAERLLYHTISSDVCLTTLVSNEHKAMLVRCLDLQTNLDSSEIDILLRALTKTKSLNTLRIGLRKYTIYDDNWRSATTDLENVLWWESILSLPR